MKELGRWREGEIKKGVEKQSEKVEEMEQRRDRERGRKTE